MELSLFDYVLKDRTASTKWDRLTRTEKELVSMRFVAAIMSGREYVKILKYGDQALSDGRTISILHLQIGLGEFVFAIPMYKDGVLALLDFDISDCELMLEGWPSTDPH